MQCPLKEDCPKEQISKRVVQSRLLLGEGPDEKNFFEAFLRFLGIKGIQPMQYGGKNALLGFLELVTKSQPEFMQVTHLAITADANGNESGTLASLREAFGRFGMPIPDDRRFATNGHITTGMFVVRDRLETVCLNSLRGQAAERCIEQYLECVGYGASPGNREKAKSRVYLSCKDNSTLSLGVAALKGYWDYQNQAFDDIRSFLQELAR
ncbi:MAG: hypothetical protein HY234_00920 [Acidobacteria bacterium]|nr:hypothetical protein [Acidobacteriota bacterium]